MSSIFPIHFVQYVIPRLRRLATAEACCVVRGVEDWPGACDALWDYAKRCGAMYLPEEAIDGLWDWMSATLIEEIDSQKAELSTMASDGL